VNTTSLQEDYIIISSIMKLSSHYWDPDSDSVSSIESSRCRCRERKHVNDQMSDLRSVNSSLSKAVQLLSCALQEKEDTILDMQEMHERRMLELLKTKLSNSNSVASCSCQCRGISSSASDQRGEANAGGGEGEGRGSTNKIWCKVTSGMSGCGRSLLSKIKTQASARSIPKVVTICNTSQIDNMAS